MQAELFTTSALLPDIIKHNESPKVTSATIRSYDKERRNFILVTCHHPDLERASYWLKQIPLRDERPEALLRSGKWKVISMEFLRSFFKRHIAGKLVTECGVVK